MQKAFTLKYKAFGTESDSEDAGRDLKASLEYNPLSSETMKTMKTRPEKQNYLPKITQLAKKRASPGTCAS